MANKILKHRWFGNPRFFRRKKFYWVKSLFIKNVKQRIRGLDQSFDTNWLKFSRLKRKGIWKDFCAHTAHIQRTIPLYVRGDCPWPMQMGVFVSGYRIGLAQQAACPQGWCFNHWRVLRDKWPSRWGSGLWICTEPGFELDSLSVSLGIDDWMYSSLPTVGDIVMLLCLIPTQPADRARPL